MKRFLLAVCCVSMLIFPGCMLHVMGGGLAFHHTGLWIGTGLVAAGAGAAVVYSEYEKKDSLVENRR